VMAKAVEDTAFYRYNRLLALNEVGGDPGRFGVGLDAFHQDNAERLRNWPLCMVTTSTHDSKRGEDAAARLAVLSEMPTEWMRSVMRWTRQTEPHRTAVDGEPAPTRRDQYTLFQALVGAWPPGWDGRQGREALVSRTARYLEKALREAKQETSWLRPNEAYEAAVRRYLEATLADDGFVADLGGFCARLSTPGAANSLAMVLLRVCAPGVPDTYQGAELWNQSYVDPDNRVEVDYQSRRRRLAELRVKGGDRAGLARALLQHWTDGTVKMYVLQQALLTRARLRDVFLRGDYEPVRAGDHVVSFVRGGSQGRVVAVAPRLSFRLTRGEQPWPIGAAWGDLRLVVPAGRYRDVFTDARFQVGDEPLRLADVLAILPVALLVEEERGLERARR